MITPPATATAAFTGAAWWATTHRRSPAVRQWRPSALSGRRVGPLHVRTGGVGEPIIVLLHGLVATGDIFGADFDRLANTATLVAPDLLGFARSLDEARSEFAPDDHLDALDHTLSLLGLGDRPIVIGAHSMGAALAIRWANRHPTRIQRVVCWGAPAYPDTDAINTAIADAGLMARTFVANTTWAERACRLNCRYRTAAGWAAAAATPALPVPIARAASLHTWPAYRCAMTQLVAGTNWFAQCERLAPQNVRVDLVWGAHDRIGDRDFARTLPDSRVAVVPDADHRLPLTHGPACAAQLKTALSSGGRPHD